MFEVIETSQAFKNDAGTLRLLVLADPGYDGPSPREDYDHHLGVMVGTARGHVLPFEDGPVAAAEVMGAVAEHDFRVVARWLRLYYGATVVLPLYNGGGHGVRLSAGDLGDAPTAGNYLGVIYDDRAVRVGSMTEAQIARSLRAEVKQYDTWANGEMVAYRVERLVGEDGDEEDGNGWVEEGTIYGYFTAEEAREAGLAELDTLADAAQAEHVEALHARALRENVARDLAEELNLSAQFLPIMGPDELPAIEVAGVGVTVYVDESGMLAVAVATDTGNVHPMLLSPDGDRVALRVSLNGHVLFEDAALDGTTPADPAA